MDALSDLGFGRDGSSGSFISVRFPSTSFMTALLFNFKALIFEMNVIF